MGEDATYDMQDNSAVLWNGNSRNSRRKKTQERRRNRHTDSNQYHYYTGNEHDDCGHSLTYSSSSCASGASIDSSIGDGLRLVEIENIDIANPATLSALLKKGESRDHRRVSSSSRRVNQFSSSNNSTDGSHSSTHTPPSNHSINTPRGKKMPISNESPRDVRSLRSHSPSARSDTSGTSSGNSTPTSPPPRSRSSVDSVQGRASIQKEVWYSKSWMCGFTDAFHFGSP